MVEVHAGYFLVGVFIFTLFRMAETTEKLGSKEIPRKDGSIIFQYLLGGVFILCAINMLQYMVSQPPELSFLILTKLLPFIIFSISVIFFGCIPFIAPSKNFLIALLISTVVTIIISIILLYFVDFLVISEGYMPLIKIAISVVSGIVIGVIVYIILWKLNPDGNSRLWEAKMLWKRINNKKFQILFSIIVGIETYLQMQLESLLTFFI